MHKERVTSRFPFLPSLLTQWVINNNTWCKGQILFNITNVGDSTIAPWVYGPINVTAAPESKVRLVDPGSYLYSTHNGTEGTDEMDLC